MGRLSEVCWYCAAPLDKRKKTTIKNDGDGGYCNQKCYKKLREKEQI